MLSEQDIISKMYPEFDSKYKNRSIEESEQSQDPTPLSSPSTSGPVVDDVRKDTEAVLLTPSNANKKSSMINEFVQFYQKTKDGEGNESKTVFSAPSAEEWAAVPFDDDLVEQLLEQERDAQGDFSDQSSTFTIRQLNSTLLAKIGQPFQMDDKDWVVVLPGQPLASEPDLIELKPKRPRKTDILEKNKRFYRNIDRCHVWVGGRVEKAETPAQNGPQREFILFYCVEATQDGAEGGDGEFKPLEPKDFSFNKKMTPWASGAQEKSMRQRIVQDNNEREATFRLPIASEDGSQTYCCMHLPYMNARNFAALRGRHQNEEKRKLAALASSSSSSSTTTTTTKSHHAPPTPPPKKRRVEPTLIETPKSVPSSPIIKALVGSDIINGNLSGGKSARTKLSIDSVAAPDDNEIVQYTTNNAQVSSTVLPAPTVNLKKKRKVSVNATPEKEKEKEKEKGKDSFPVLASSVQWTPDAAMVLIQRLVESQQLANMPNEWAEQQTVGDIRASKELKAAMARLVLFLKWAKPELLPMLKPVDVEAVLKQPESNDSAQINSVYEALDF